MITTTKRMMKKRRIIKLRRPILALHQPLRICLLKPMLPNKRLLREKLRTMARFLLQLMSLRRKK